MKHLFVIVIYMFVSFVSQVRFIRNVFCICVILLFCIYKASHIR